MTDLAFRIEDLLELHEQEARGTAQAEAAQIVLSSAMTIVVTDDIELADIDEAIKHAYDLMKSR
jgi:hypothetical protein